MFNHSRVCKLNFQKESFDYNQIKGGYPGPINNFFIANFYNSWNDPTDIDIYGRYVENNLTDQTDYTIFTKPVYNELKSYFGSMFDIKRKAISHNGDIIVEVNLRKVD